MTSRNPALLLCLLAAACLVPARAQGTGSQATKTQITVHPDETVTISMGERDGVRPGHTGEIKDSTNWPLASFRVTSVEDTSARLQVQRQDKNMPLSTGQWAYFKDKLVPPPRRPARPPAEQKPPAGKPDGPAPPPQPERQKSSVELKTEADGQAALGLHLDAARLYGYAADAAEDAGLDPGTIQSLRDDATRQRQLGESATADQVQIKKLQAEMMLAKGSDQDKAYELGEQLLQLDPNSGMARDIVASGLIVRAMTDNTAGRYADCEQKLNRAVALDQTKMNSVLEMLNACTGKREEQEKEALRRAEIEKAKVRLNEALNADDWGAAREILEMVKVNDLAAFYELRSSMNTFQNDRFNALEVKLRAAEAGRDVFGALEQRDQLVKIFKSVEGFAPRLELARDTVSRLVRDMLPQWEREARDNVFHGFHAQAEAVVANAEELGREFPDALALAARIRELGEARRRAGGETIEIAVGNATLVFAWVPVGEVRIGTPAAVPTKNGCRSFAEEPWTAIERTGFWMLDAEVTVGQWVAVTGEPPQANDSCDAGNACPVTNVSWPAAQKFVEKLNAQKPGHGFRLPLEAEWEYAARAGSTDLYGVPCPEAEKDWDCDRRLKCIEEYAWYKKTSGRDLQAVRRKKPNAWKLYDMLGNAQEWVFDVYDAKYPIGTATIESPPASTAPATGQRAVRGGSYESEAPDVRAARRDAKLSTIVSPMIGFRIVRETLKKP